MSMNTNFSNSSFFDGQESSMTNSGFTPLTPDQMDRLKGGFDVVESEDESSGDRESDAVDEPVDGELGEDLTDG